MRQFILPIFIALTACVQGSVSDTVEITTPIQIAISIPSGLSGLTIPATLLTQNEPVNISDALSQVEKVGTPSVVITKNHLHSNMGDFSFFDSISLSITSDSTSQSEQLVSMTLTPDQKASTDLDIPVSIDNAALLQILDSGSTTLGFTFVVEGTVPTNPSLDLTSTIDMDVSLSVDKSISDIGTIGK